MPPDINQDDSAFSPGRAVPRIPQLLIAFPNLQNQENRQEGEGNNPEEDEQAARRRRNRLPFLLRLFLGPQIARYLRLRREMNEQRQREEQEQRERLEAEVPVNDAQNVGVEGPAAEEADTAPVDRQD